MAGLAEGLEPTARRRGLSGLYDALVVALFLTFLAGRFSIDRAFPDLADPGIEIQPRLLMIGPLAVGALAVLRNVQVLPVIRPVLGWLLPLELFFAYVAVSLSWSPSGDLFSGFVDILALAVLIIISVFVLGADPERGIHVALMCTFWVGVFYFSAAALSGGGDTYRWSVFGGGSNVFVRVVSAAAIAGIYLAGRMGHLRWLLPIPLLIVGALSSGSRGGLLALMAVYPLALGLLGQRLRTVLAGLALPLVIVAAPFFVAPTDGLASGGEVATNDPSSLVAYWEERYLTVTFEQLYLSQRDLLFADAWDQFLQQPVQGVGLDGYKIFTDLDQPYPHNLFLLILSETGLIGLALFLLTVPALIRRLRRPLSLEHLAAFCVGIFYFVASMFSGGWYDTRFVWFFILMFMLPRTRTARWADNNRRQNDGVHA